MRHEGYDKSEVATFLGVVADEMRSLQMQLEFLRSGDTATPATATPATATPGTATPGTATPGTGTPAPTAASGTMASASVAGSAPVAPTFPAVQDPLESELTLDALKDAQADLVSRVESTARDLHESLESGGRMAHPNHLRAGGYQPPRRPTPAAPTLSPTTAPQATPTPPAVPNPPPPVQPAAAQAAPAPVARAAEPIVLNEADLSGDHLQEARNKLDSVLDDVMGSILPKD